MRLFGLALVLPQSRETGRRTQFPAFRLLLARSHERREPYLNSDLNAPSGIADSNEFAYNLAILARL